MSSASPHAGPPEGEAEAEASRQRFTESPTRMSAGATTTDDEEEDEDGTEDSEDDSEEDDEDDDDDEDSSDEEEEPALKYSRIEGNVPELLKKDSASAIAVSGNRLIALGTHAGIVHILDLTGKRLKSYKPHLASIVDIEFDETGEWVATASIDGQVHVRFVSLSPANANNEHYSYDLKRPMRSIAMEPHFASRRNTRAFVCGGLAGNLILYEKGWLGHRETVIASGEGPIWLVRWVGIGTSGNGLIAWANDAGVKIYHPSSRSLLTFIDRAPNSPRSELFKPSLYWQDEGTLLIAWADYIKVVRVRARPNNITSSPSNTTNVAGAAGSTSQVSTAPFVVEVTAVFQIDGCAVAGIAPHPMISIAEQTEAYHSREASIRTNEVSEDGENRAKSPLNGERFRPTPQRRHSIPIVNAPPLTTFLLLSYTPPPALLRYSEDDADQVPTESTHTKRTIAERPELRIVSRSTGEELANDMLGVRDFEKWGCNEYSLGVVRGEEDELAQHKRVPSNLGPNGLSRDKDKERCYVVMSPRDLVLVRRRDLRDRVQWLVDRARWQEALHEVEKLEQIEAIRGKRQRQASISSGGGFTVDAVDEDAEKGEKEKEKDELTVHSIGEKYIQYLVDQEEYVKAAALTPKVCGRGTGSVIEKRWEGWIWEFAGRHQLQAIIPYVPTDAPRLDHVVYEMILAHFLTRDLRTLYKMVTSWSRDIYDIAAVILAVKAQLERLEKGGSLPEGYEGLSRQEAVKLLMECLAELYTANRQYGKALPYFLRLRRPNVFELIRDHNLFTDVQDQVLLLVEFDHELMEKRKKEKEAVEAAAKTTTTATTSTANGELVKAKDFAPPTSKAAVTPGEPEGAALVTGKQWQQSEAIKLLVNNIHSISINKVVQQLQTKQYYLFLYLDALVEKDPHLVSAYADLQVKLYAEFTVTRLIDFLRTSNYYNLERAYGVCNDRDLVPEMVFLLGRMGNNKKALTLIIERLGDVERAIEFAKSQNDDDLWEDLLRYSETRPTFIRGLLQNVGVEISPVRLIRRIRNGLEIPGLKDALVKILQDFHLQIELLEGCRAILEGDCAELGELLGRRQGGGLPLSVKSKCPVCAQPLLYHQHLAPATTPGQSKPSSSDTVNAHSHSSPFMILFLCRHIVHASCAGANLSHLPYPTDPVLRSVGYGKGGKGQAKGMSTSSAPGMSGIIAFESMVRPRLRQGCPVCHAKPAGGAASIASY